MNRNILRPIVAGILIGAALYFLPFFFLRVFLIILLISFAFRFFWGWGWRSRYYRGFHPAYTDSIRNMSDEEYKQFRQNFGSSCYPSSSNKNAEQKSENK